MSTIIPPRDFIISLATTDDLLQMERRLCRTRRKFWMWSVNDRFQQETRAASLAAVRRALDQRLNGSRPSAAQKAA